MKKCPFCGAQMNDDSLFCTECGKQIPQGIVCPHCGASVNEGDVFCQNCGKSINESPSEERIVNDDEKISVFKKYLPYIIGALVLMMIIGYCSSNESPNASSDEQVKDSFNIDNSKDNSEQEIQAKIVFLEKFYKEKNGREQSDEYAYIKKNVTANGLQNLKDLYDFECDGECLATWVFDYDEGSDIGDIKSSKIIPQSENDFLVENEYEYARYSVQLTVVKEGGAYKIDKIEQKESSYFPPEQDDTSEYVENTIDSKYVEYVGSWSYYISSGGQRLKVYTAVIKGDNTAKFVTFLPDGSLNTSIDFRQCVFANGFVFFTDNGDINIKGTPRFKLGSGGLQAPDGERLIKE